jgi:hypothetical protein
LTGIELAGFNVIDKVVAQWFGRHINPVMFVGGLGKRDLR